MGSLKWLIIVSISSILILMSVIGVIYYSLSLRQQT